MFLPFVDMTPICPHIWGGQGKGRPGDAGDRGEEGEKRGKFNTRCLDVGKKCWTMDGIWRGES